MIRLYSGAVALGHAIGNSGSRIIVSLIHALKSGQYGAAGICNGVCFLLSCTLQKYSLLFYRAVRHQHLLFRNCKSLEFLSCNTVLHIVAIILAIPSSHCFSAGKRVVGRPREDMKRSEKAGTVTVRMHFNGSADSGIDASISDAPLDHTVIWTLEWSCVCLSAPVPSETMPLSHTAVGLAINGLSM